MSIREDLKKNLVAAMKSQDSFKVGIIRFLNAAIKKKDIDTRKELDDKEIFSLVKSLCKQRKESIEQFQKGGRTDLVAKEEAELKFLESLLPPQLSREALVLLVQKAIQTVGAKGPKEMGLVMKQVMQDVAGQADGQLVSTTVKEELNKLNSA